MADVKKKVGVFNQVEPVQPVRKNPVSENEFDQGQARGKDQEIGAKDPGGFQEGFVSLLTAEICSHTTPRKNKRTPVRKTITMEDVTWTRS